MSVCVFFTRFCCVFAPQVLEAAEKAGWEGIRFSALRMGKVRPVPGHCDPVTRLWLFGTAVVWAVVLVVVLVVVVVVVMMGCQCFAWDR